MEVFCYDNKFLGIHDITDLKIPLHSLTNVQSVVVPSERLIMCDLDHRLCHRGSLSIYHSDIKQHVRLGWQLFIKLDYCRNTTTGSRLSCLSDYLSTQAEWLNAPF